MSDWDAKIHTNDRNQSFIITIMDEPTQAAAERTAKKWLKDNFPNLKLRDLLVEKSLLA